MVNGSYLISGSCLTLWRTLGLAFDSRVPCCMLRSSVSACHGGRTCTPCSCVSACHGGRTCTPCSCVSACRGDTGYTPCTAFYACRACRSCTSRSRTSPSREGRGCTSRSGTQSSRASTASIPSHSVCRTCRAPRLVLAHESGVVAFLR